MSCSGEEDNISHGTVLAPVELSSRPTHHVTTVESWYAANFASDFKLIKRALSQLG